ncbi:aquaporin Z [Nocardioides panacisoli]|uniref:aquaporin Z n=1 Tax=Nocardioides panacisoli TaxID=627624 RepID=UPI001C624CD8|nr:aquaporin Z [Nocardioides panacisoli]QYJ05402.1 aquaporin Z [Nocardioides panacisoli]
MAPMQQRLAAEFFGTFWLVLGGCGTAVLAGEQVGFIGVAFAFGLTVLTMAYAVGHVSGGHFNPAVTIGVTLARRFDAKDVPAYVATQVVGATAAAAVLFAIASGTDGFSASDGFAANGYGDHSPMGYALWSVIIAEVVLTAFFLYVILGATDTRAPRGFAPLAIGLALTLIHLISIPVSNTSVNPARSISQALFAGSDALIQLWVFLLAPVVGAVLAGVSYALFFGSGVEPVSLEEASEA